MSQPADNKGNGVSTIMMKCTEDSFFRVWMEILAPFHRLTPRERDVAARILMQYFKLKKSVSDRETLRDVLWSKPSKDDMQKSLGMSTPHFQLALRHLKAARFLQGDYNINPRFVPHVKDGDTGYVLKFLCDWSSKDKPARTIDEDKD